MHVLVVISKAVIMKHTTTLRYVDMSEENAAEATGDVAMFSDFGALQDGSTAKRTYENCRDEHQHSGSQQLGEVGNVMADSHLWMQAWSSSGREETCSIRNC